MRWGLISALAVGGVTLLVGPDQVAAGLTQLRASAKDAIGRYVEDPVALRHQLEQMAAKYPDRIAEVRGEIAEVEHQIAQFEEDIEMSRRVVALTTGDLRDLRDKVARAEAHRAESPGRVVQVRLSTGIRCDVDGALSHAKRINNVRLAYQDRVAQNEQQLGFLGEQRARLQEILDTLEDEHASFQAQLWQLDRQIDAIARNERLIELTEQQQETLRDYEKFGDVGNFGQLQARLAELQAEQEAKLETLSNRMGQDDYEKRAMLEMGELETESLEDVFDDIDLEDAAETEATADDRSLAWKAPIVVE